MDDFGALHRIWLRRPPAQGDGFWHPLIQLLSFEKSILVLSSGQVNNIRPFSSHA
jgi:hypothetical protein